MFRKETPLEIVTVDDEGAGILREDLSGIDEDPSELQLAGPALERLCRVTLAAGLAAPQAGVRHNFFVMAHSYWSNKTCQGGVPKGMVFVNPVWEPVGRLKDTAEEGCKSLPGRIFMVSRHYRIRASWDTLDGRRITRLIWGHTARCFQHEHDHLRGVCLDQSADAKLMCLPSPTKHHVTN